MRNLKVPREVDYRPTKKFMQWLRIYRPHVYSILTQNDKLRKDITVKRLATPQRCRLRFIGLPADASPELDRQVDCDTACIVIELMDIF